jgi:hypothetical protein
VTGPYLPDFTPAEIGGMTPESMAYYERMIQLVDARIEASKRKVVDFGTVQDRDVVGPGATVVFDGSQDASPVKVPGHVHCFAGDRVVLQLVKGTWVVMGTFNRRQLAEASLRMFGPNPAGTSTSATFVDQPVAMSLPFSKRYDLTATAIELTTTMYMATSGGAVQTAVRVSGAPGTLTATTFTPIDLAVGYHPFPSSPLVVAWPVYGFTRTVALPAGDYVLVPRWRRANGAGTMTQDNGHLIQLAADEIFRSTEV